METRELIWIEMMKFYGLREVPGVASNPLIIKWFKELGYPGIQDDETAWCSLTVNIMAKNSGLEFTGKLDARSWMKIGTEVIEPHLGHIVIFWREKIKGWKGHVALFAGYNSTKNKIWCLGGNQNNQIGMYEYPILTPTFGLLGYRSLNYR